VVQRSTTAATAPESTASSVARVRGVAADARVGAACAPRCAVDESGATAATACPRRGVTRGRAPLSDKPPPPTVLPVFCEEPPLPPEPPRVAIPPAFIPGAPSGPLGAAPRPPPAITNGPPGPLTKLPPPAAATRFVFVLRAHCSGAAYRDAQRLACAELVDTTNVGAVAAEDAQIPR
jgi:hypothetical protein